MALGEKTGMEDSAHTNKVAFSKDPEGQMELPEKQAVPEYVGKGKSPCGHQLTLLTLRLVQDDR